VKVQVATGSFELLLGQSSPAEGQCFCVIPGFGFFFCGPPNITQVAGLKLGTGRVPLRGDREGSDRGTAPRIQAHLATGPGLVVSLRRFAVGGIPVSRACGARALSQRIVPYGRRSRRQETGAATVSVPRIFQLILESAKGRDPPGLSVGKSRPPAPPRIRGDDSSIRRQPVAAAHSSGCRPQSRSNRPEVSPEGAM